jgi:predicted deacylase
MTVVHHPLLSATPGTKQELLSLHYGTPGAGPKVMVQASLHADEVPGMLVAHHLRQRLDALQAQGRISGEVVLVPMANPIGVGQWLLRGFQGRFDLASGENFNRHYADLTDAVARAVAGRLGDDEAANVALVRVALRDAVAALPVATALESLRKTLFGLAIDADIVLDLHCDGEALLHFYTTPGCWPQAELLARCIGAEAALLATRSGGDPFDEACSMPWPQLADKLGRPLPQACLAVTIELRGEGDVQHELAAQDAEGILHFLALRGVISGDVPPAPPLRCQPTPLAGSIPLTVPSGGMVVFQRTPGAQVQAGELIAELIDPLTATTTPIRAPVDGLFFARDNRRFAVAGMSIGKVAGAEATRQGKLLSA